mgnify:CR=1 FL=1
MKMIYGVNDKPPFAQLIVFAYGSDVGRTGNCGQ